MIIHKSLPIVKSRSSDRCRRCVPPVEIAQKLARRGRNMRLTGQRVRDRRRLPRARSEPPHAAAQAQRGKHQLSAAAQPDARAADKNYLRNTTLSAEDIAYLLGYQDLNSFYRAFSLWTGKSISEYKAELADDEG